MTELSGKSCHAIDLIGGVEVERGPLNAQVLMPHLNAGHNHAEIVFEP